MSQPVYFLDVNIPMYAAGRPHPYRESCVKVMTAIAQGQLTAAIDTEIIQEILHRFGSLQSWQLDTTLASNLLQLVPEVYPVTLADIQETVRLFSRYGPQGAKARDLLHVAVMWNRGLTHIISTDTHFDTIPGLSRLDPRTMFPDAANGSPTLGEAPQ